MTLIVVMAVAYGRIDGLCASTSILANYVARRHDNLHCTPLHTNQSYARLVVEFLPRSTATNLSTHHFV